MRRMPILAFSLAVLGIVSPSISRADLVIGGWDAARGGSYSLRDGSAAADLRALIAANFVGATITATPTLDAAYLSTVDVLLIGGVKEGIDFPIASLTAAEQAALLDFVRAGGGAILISDNNAPPAHYDVASNSFNHPFGVNVTGLLFPEPVGTVTNPSHPVTSGPFGTAAGFTGGYAGYFDDLGPNAEALATFDANGLPGVAALDHGVLAPGSGGVVFFSDSFPIDHLSTVDNQRLTLNAIAFARPQAVPEPSSLLLLGAGALGLLAVGRRRSIARR